MRRIVAVVCLLGGCVPAAHRLVSSVPPRAAHTPQSVAVVVPTPVVLPQPAPIAVESAPGDPRFVGTMWSVDEPATFAPGGLGLSGESLELWVVPPPVHDWICGTALPRLSYGTRPSIALTTLAYEIGRAPPRKNHGALELKQLRGNDETKSELRPRSFLGCFERAREVAPIVAHFATRIGGTLVLLRASNASEPLAACIADGVRGVELDRRTPLNLEVDVVMRWVPP